VIAPFVRTGLIAAALVLPAAAQVPVPAPVPPPVPIPAQDPEFASITNFFRVNAQVCTGGQPSPADLARMKQQGIRAIFNLRRASEHNAAEEESQARALGLRYVHIPVDGTKIQDLQVDAFLRASRDPKNQPAFIHCGSGNRVGGLWLIRRVLVDKWPPEDAEAEAKKIGLREGPVRDFALDYLRRAPALEELKAMRNYARVAEGVHISAQPRPEHFEKLRAAGIKTVLNLRSPGEHRAAEEQAQAEASGLRYINVPLVYTDPKDQAVDEFLRVLDDAANRPVLIHCTTTIRVSALWMIRRVLRDGLSLEAAAAEAAPLGLANSPDMRDFASAYIARHKK
jgi:uncharacterized protein (TIGR01244 family)